MNVRKRGSAPISRLFAGLITSLVIVSIPASTLRAGAETTDERPAISLSALHIEPAEPTVDQLCRLAVKLENSGSEILSRLVFRVVINGHELHTYRNQMFLTRVGPDETTTIHLYSFWTTESGRPAPADDKLRVEVTLTEASWVRVEQTADGDAWHPVGPVPGLPISASAVMPLQKQAAGT